MLNRQGVVEAIHKGILEANETYEKWSGGEWVTDETVGVEPVMTVMVAKRLFQAYAKAAGPEYLTMEATFASIEQCSGAENDEETYPPGWTDGRKVDIAIWAWAEKLELSRPRAVIEIKRSWQASVREDIGKILNLLNRAGTAQGGSLEYGVIAFGVAAEQGGRAKDINRRIADYKAKIKEEVAGRAYLRFHVSKRRLNWKSGGPDDLKWKCAAFCAVISAPCRD